MELLRAVGKRIDDGLDMPMRPGWIALSRED